MPKLTNEKKLEAMKAWLDENKIEYVENYKKNNIEMDLWIPSLYIAVHIGDDQVFYRKTRKWLKPFFIRDSETKAFVLEKLQNCALEQMVYLHKRHMKENEKKQKENKS